MKTKTAAKREPRWCTSMCPLEGLQDVTCSQLVDHAMPHDRWTVVLKDDGKPQQVHVRWWDGAMML